MATHTKKHIKRRGHIANNELILKSDKDSEFYGEIINPKGDTRFEVQLLDKRLVVAKARGSIISGPKKQRLNKNDMVLLQFDPNTTTGDKYYIIHKYSQDDIKRLRKSGELATIKDDEDVNNNIVFEHDIIEDNEDVVQVNDDFIDNI